MSALEPAGEVVEHVAPAADTLCVLACTNDDDCGSAGGAASCDDGVCVATRAAVGGASDIAEREVATNNPGGGDPGGPMKPGDGDRDTPVVPTGGDRSACLAPPWTLTMDEPGLSLTSSRATVLPAATTVSALPAAAAMTACTGPPTRWRAYARSSSA